MSFPNASQDYDHGNETRFRAAVNQADMQNHKRNRDIEMGQARLILTSPNGTRYAVAVDNAGALSTVAV